MQSPDHSWLDTTKNTFLLISKLTQMNVVLTWLAFTVYPTVPLPGLTQIEVEGRN